MEILKTEYILIITGTLIIIGFILAISLIVIRKKSERTSFERYDNKTRMVELDYFRKNLERQQYEISRKLEENEKRWNDINHLIISSQNKLNENINRDNDFRLNDFLKNANINEKNINEIDDSLVFVLTPFNERFIKSYESILDVCSKYGLRCLRGDERFVEGDIFPQIMKHIVNAKIIIANITGRNPNVFYELGIAHALNKPTIIISENLSDATFDIQSKNILLFKSQKELIEKLESTIVKLSLNKF
jgi:nucleoside 2-deoxyribosyltransferase